MQQSENYQVIGEHDVTKLISTIRNNEVIVIFVMFKQVQSLTPSVSK